MPRRTFVDDRGKSWEIWEVHPSSVERRALERRHKQAAAWTGAERRANSNRRRKLSVPIDPAQPLAHGWLVFKSADEKRRLAPIPPNWESIQDRGLRDLLEQARITASRIEEAAWKPLRLLSR